MWQRVWYQDEETGKWYSRREDDFGMTQEERDENVRQGLEYMREIEGWEP